MTFCPRLWNEIYIDEKGNVFSCCHSKPTAFGNIHKQKLKEICNNKTIKDLRQKSLNGQLHCFHPCKLLDKNRIGPFSKNTLTISYDQLKRIKILFGEACNLNCIMCVQDSKSE